MRHARRLAVIAAGVVLVAGGCGGEESDAEDAASVGAITVEDVWVRPASAGGGTTAAYMTITNDGAGVQTLVAATSTACGVAELHMSAVEDGVMTMSPLAEGVAVAPESSVVLGPGGLHVMCLEVTRDLVEGDTAEFTLEFSDGSSIVVDAAVRSDG